MPSDATSANVGDGLHALIKAGLSTVPVLGGPAAELFQLLVQPPIERRRQAWMQEVGERLRQLESTGLDLSALQKDESFISAAMQVSSAAIRTHKEEKLSALRNALLNIAVGKGPEETIQHLLLSFIDELSEMHLRVLAFARSPKPPPHITAGALSHILEQNIPTLQGQRTLYDQLWRDLHTRGLVGAQSLHVMMSGNGLGQSQTSPLGESLLHLIAEQ